MLTEIAAERYRQEELREQGKFRYTCASAEMDNTERLAVLAEEFGEVALAVCELMHAKHEECRMPATVRDQRDVSATRANLREELVQVAAVCLAWLESDCT